MKSGQLKRTPFRRKPGAKSLARHQASLRRSAGHLRRGAMRKVNRKRKARERERAYGPPERRDWITSQPCAVSGETRDIDPAHVKTDGMGRKADARFVIPLAHRLHVELHQHGPKTFEAKYGVNLLALAAEYDRRWQSHLAERGA